jgi:hypothetical protein
MEVQQDGTIGDVLKSAQAADKIVTVDMNNGKTYRGSIIQVGQFHLRLELKGDKGFYDAFIKLDHISAVEVQIRE